MIRIEPLGINQYQFLVVTIQLPSLTSHLIYCTKGILFDECWNIDKLEYRCKVPVCIGQGKKIEELLEKEIIYCSNRAKEKGICLTMKGQQALLGMIDED